MTVEALEAERALLRQALDQLARYPGMYGSPGAVEGLATHVVHVLLCMHRDAWSFTETEALWKGVAKDLGFGERCARDEESRRIMRWALWGEEEETARSQVVAGFQRIWTVLRERAPDAPCTSRWIEALFREPNICGPPDVLDCVLFGLMLFINPNERETLRSMLDAECVRVRGVRTRPLFEVGTTKAVRARTPKRYPTESGEGDVVAGIREAARRVDDILGPLGIGGPRPRLTAARA